MRTSGSRAPVNLVLMYKNVLVAAFDYNARTRSVRNVRPLDGASLAPLGACDTRGDIDPINLGGWLGMRHIPHGRAGLSKLLRDAGRSDPAELMFSSLALNLSDQYWVVPQGISIDWHEVNYFENPYVDRRENTMYASGWRGLFGPVTSTAGQVYKWWERREDGNYLVKGSTAYDQSWLDLTAHEDFSQEVRRVLSSNPEQRGWFAEAAARQFEIRLDYLRALVV